MGFLCRHRAAPASFSLLCEEDSESAFGCVDGDVEEMVPALGKMMMMSPDFSCTFGLQLGDDCDELVGSFMEKEVEQLVGTARGEYLKKLSNGGIEFACRVAAIDWIFKVQAQYNFGPLCAYLAVNYLDRFLSSVQFSNDMPWMQQLLIVACLSIAAKMEETTVPGTLDLQVCNPEYVFDAKTIHRMEIVILTTLKWRMQAVTPFSYIDHFLDKINEGEPLKYELVSRCTEIILGTIKVTEFLKFRPSEIATAVALSVVSDGRVLDLGSVLESCNIPVDKENVGRCHQAMQEMALVMLNSTESPSDVLDTSCFISKSDDNTTPGTSPPQVDNGNSDNNNNQACTPASKRTRLEAAPMS
ncbi:putative cyclin-D2-3 [Oryza brachyantha]|uniref:putative cyclin-D2-3 n=1 Tax=Oryza brachyantha TaxID=4533 RepID=UPI0003EACC23|nr:putative cyclin-D2-3 [Oryza brachyantha]